jgi:hypothetical protein
MSFTFYEIKELVGLAGANLGALSHLEQKQGGGGASKGNLLSAIDGIFFNFAPNDQSRFLVFLGQSILERKPHEIDQLEAHLARHGWQFVDGKLIAIEFFDAKDLPELSDTARTDLLKAAQRFHSGDLSGAISAACAAVDSTTSKIYQERELGDPSKASFQERCKKACQAAGIKPSLEVELKSLDWPIEDINLFSSNFEGSLNQGAYVIQTLRSKMGDVHGTKPVLKPLVFMCLRWAELVVRSLTKT